MNLINKIVQLLIKYSKIDKKHAIIESAEILKLCIDFSINISIHITYSYFIICLQYLTKFILIKYSYLKN